METTNRQTSKITPEMIDQYRQLLSLRQDEVDWLRDDDRFGNYAMGFPAVYPFTIRFEQRPCPYLLTSVAYLAVVCGAAQWRYSSVDPGYERCPVVHDRNAIRQLHLSDGLACIDRCFFSSPETAAPLVIPEDECIVELYCEDGPGIFVSHRGQSGGLPGMR